MYDDDDVYCYIGERLKLEGKTENMVVWTKKRGRMKAVVLMATFVRQVTHHLPEGTAPHRLHPPPLARIDVPTRLARIRPGPTDIRHGMIRGWVM